MKEYILKRNSRVEACVGCAFLTEDDRCDIPLDFNYEENGDCTISPSLVFEKITDDRISNYGTVVTQEVKDAYERIAREESIPEEEAERLGVKISSFDYRIRMYKEAYGITDDRRPKAKVPKKLAKKQMIINLINKGFSREDIAKKMRINVTGVRRVQYAYRQKQFTL